MIRNGELTVTYAGNVLMKDMAFADYQKGGNRLQIRTWAGDSVRVRLNEVAELPASALSNLQPPLHPIK